ncbi:MAG: PKD domain-containing protein [Lewinellaceae bacterium]|nr:PKD domain-containing protein [Lewinellaceae bacterium]
MRNLSVILFVFMTGLPLGAQETAPERPVDFNFSEEGPEVKFAPVLPALMQKAGAPAAHWEFFWEFGDGSFSREEQPAHSYASPGEYIVSLDATAHYDDGKKPKKKKKPVATSGSSGRLAGLSLPDVFDPEGKEAVAMASNTQPKAEEELVCIISYRNNGAFTTSGRLHLFFNEKSYPATHFTFTEARTHFGETGDPLLSHTLPGYESPAANWVALSPHLHTGVSTLWPADPPASIIQTMLNEARGKYREEHAWRFTELEPGGKRNLFVSLAATAGMIRDTSAFIHLEAVFAPDDPVIAPERYEMEIEVVASHDPNAIAVSDNRVNYRSVGDKKLAYKVQFQNNGEGPASTVELKVEVPQGLDMARMRPVDWYPKCPICPKTPTSRSCLDTATTKDGILFTFRNIYLPGTRQKNVDHRDSTKGFVKYRIEVDKDMPKLSFRSRAKITFDKNPPIYTNFTKTRFKPGVSPGLKIGYGFSPDSSKSGYVFFGASLSPYKSWRIYPQVELLTGIKGREELSSVTHSDSLLTADGDLKILLTRDSTVKITRGFVSFEIPFLLRKNFSRFFGAGLGISAKIVLENGETVGTVHKVRTFLPNAGMPPPPPQVQDSDFSSPYSATHTRFSVFGDLSFGSVRAGPNVGIRAGAILGSGKTAEPFVQISLEMKL